MDKRSQADLFRDRLLEALALTGQSRAGLARAVGIDRSGISQILAPGAARMPGAHVVAGMAQVLRVSSDWLLGLSDRPEPVGSILASTLSVTEAERTAVDRQVDDWHREAAGLKIRHVPATLPDLMKTRDLWNWEYAPLGGRSGYAVTAAEDQMARMQDSESDYEIALPLCEIEAFARGEGYYRGLDTGIRQAQLDWMLAVYDRLYPTLRLFFYDARRVFSAPLTVFGPRMAVLYLGRNFITFREKERVRSIARHFDWLIREGLPEGQQPGEVLTRLRAGMS